MRIVRNVIIVVAIVLIVVVVGVMLTMNHLVRTGIELGASQVLGTQTTVGSASVKLFAGELGIGNLVIRNPEGFETEDFFSMKSGLVGVDLGSLLSETAVVEEIVIDKPVLTIERKGGETNLSMIMDNLGKNAKAEEEKQEGKGYKIKRILIKGTTAKFLLLGKEPMSLELGDIEIKDLGSGENNAVKMGTVVLEVLGKMTVEIAKEGAEQLPADLLKNVEGAGDVAKEALEGLTKDAGKALEDVGKGVKDTLDKLPKDLPKLPFGEDKD